MNLGRETKSAVNSRKAMKPSGKVQRILSITREKKQVKVINENDPSNKINSKWKKGNMETTENYRKTSISTTSPDSIHAVIKLQRYGDNDASQNQTALDNFNLTVHRHDNYEKNTTLNTRYTRKYARHCFRDDFENFENKQNSRSCPFLHDNESISNALSFKEGTDNFIPVEPSTNLDKFRRYSSAREDIKYLLDDASRTVER